TASPYLAIQTPRLLLSPSFYSGFWGRYLFRDCGLVTSALIVYGFVEGVISQWKKSEGRASLQPLTCWSVMGAVFCFAFAPKFLDHDYYELMFLPSAATWGAMGLFRLLEPMTAQPARRVAVLCGVLMLAAAVQSPWCTSEMFRIDRGKLILAERLKAW